MHNRRFTRLTNGFSKKLYNHAHMVALYTDCYKFVRMHKSLRIPPAMAAGVENQALGYDGRVALRDAKQVPNNPRGPCRSA